MEMTMRLPANYNLINEQEMTYTEGGATAVQALCAWFLPFYGWYKGATAIRDYRRANPETWIETGLDAFTADMESSVVNMIYDVGCASKVIAYCGSLIGLIPTALIIFS